MGILNGWIKEKKMMSLLLNYVLFKLIKTSILFIPLSVVYIYLLPFSPSMFCELFFPYHHLSRVVLWEWRFELGKEILKWVNRGKMRESFSGERGRERVLFKSFKSESVQKRRRKKMKRSLRLWGIVG